GRLHLVQPDRPGRLADRARRGRRDDRPGRAVRPQPRSARRRPGVHAIDRHAPRRAGIPPVRRVEGAAGMRPGILSAHGYDPGPTQRPVLAGASAGVLATIPAIALLYAFGSLKVEAAILGRSELATLAVG